MKFYSVKFALNVQGLGELNLPEPYIYEAENIPQLVADITPIATETELTIVSIRPATDDEVYTYLKGDVADEDTEDPEWDEPDDEYDAFWEELINNAD